MANKTLQAKWEYYLSQADIASMDAEYLTAIEYAFFFGAMAHNDLIYEALKLEDGKEMIKVFEDLTLELAEHQPGMRRRT